ncbi:hypothetical protein BGW80DRAFT_1464164 [Lactifluus volemus]|nr:hypothetical protein BGW80DRAFT_1464164 [Lactifluus volemus]
MFLLSDTFVPYSLWMLAPRHHVTCTGTQPHGPSAALDIPSAQLSRSSISNNWHSRQPINIFSLLNREQELLGKGQVIMRHQKARIDQRQLGLISFPRVTIRSLPDNVLLHIFDYCQILSLYGSHRWWHALIHVCQRWRYIVLEPSSRHKLRLVCNGNTPMKKTLDVWPRSFPIVVSDWRSPLPLGGVNLIAALEHYDRVSEIDLNLTSTLLKRVYKVMSKPYPVLTRLRLYTSESAPVLRDTFLGGSSPRLKHLDLTAMATALSVLTELKYISIDFESPASFPDPTNRLPSSFRRVVLPALTCLEFCGSSEYFEDLVARIDTPVMTSVDTWFFNPSHLDFDIPHFLQFIGRTELPRSFEVAELYFSYESILILFGYRITPERNEYPYTLSIKISCHGFDRQVTCLAQICGKISPLLSNVQRLLIVTSWPPRDNLVFLDWKDHVDNPKWLEILQAFSASQHMHISPKLGEIIASALQELTGERARDALPVLRHLYLPSPSAYTQQAIESFIFSRQHSNYPITVHLREMD